MPTCALIQGTQGMAEDTAATDERTKAQQCTGSREHAALPKLPVYLHTL